VRRIKEPGQGLGGWGLGDGDGDGDGGGSEFSIASPCFAQQASIDTIQSSISYIHTIHIHTAVRQLYCPLL